MRVSNCFMQECRSWGWGWRSLPLKICRWGQIHKMSHSLTQNCCITLQVSQHQDEGIRTFHCPVFSLLELHWELLLPRTKVPGNFCSRERMFVPVINSSRVVARVCEWGKSWNWGRQMEAPYVPCQRSRCHRRRGWGVGGGLIFFFIFTAQCYA